MNKIRQFVEVKNHSFNVSLPDDFTAKKVEIIIIPCENTTFKFPQKTKNILDFRLNDYLQNPKNVNDFDDLLDQLEKDL